MPIQVRALLANIPATTVFFPARVKSITDVDIYQKQRVKKTKFEKSPNKKLSRLAL